MAIDDILKMLPIDDIAKQFGVSNEVAAQAAEQGGSVLLSGLAKNASTAEGSAAIEKALQKHAGTTGASSVDQIDKADGDKIVKHVLGNDASAVADKLTQSDKTAGIDFAKLLPILAPIVMGLIANATKNKSGAPAAAEESSGGIGDLLGGLVGGGSGAGGGIGDVIGGLLGGGSKGGSAGGIDLGGILGGLGGLFGKK